MLSAWVILATAFLAETRSRVATIVSAIDTETLVVLEREAHTLKGNAGNFGLTQLAELAHQVVLLCRTQQGPEACRLAREVPACFEAAAERLNRELAAFAAQN